MDKTLFVREQEVCQTSQTVSSALYLPFHGKQCRPRVETLRQGPSQSERFLSIRNRLRVMKVFASCTGERIHCSVKLAQ